MFVRPWLRTQQAFVEKPSMIGLQPWIPTMNMVVVSFVSKGATPTVGVNVQWPMFLDFIQLGEQGRFNRNEPQHAAVWGTALRT